MHQHALAEGPHRLRGPVSADLGQGLGKFFPLVLGFGIALSVALVRGELSPAVAVQQVVGRGERHLTSQAACPALP